MGFPVLGIGVIDRYQNLGLGRLLMEHLIDEARRRGERGLELSVYKNNGRALHLYRSLGFIIFDGTEDHKQYLMRLSFRPI